MRTNENKQNILPVDEATVQERQVTVKVLTIGTKQVTQALYKQMVEENVMEDKTSNLRGPVWGWVNIHADCEPREKHLHAIWEDNGQLKKTCVYEDIDYKNKYYSSRFKNINFWASRYVELISLADMKINGQWRDFITLTVKGRKVHVSFYDHFRMLWGTDNEERKISLKAEIRRYLDEALDANHLDKSSISHKQVYEKMEALATELADLETQWSTSYKAIQDAGQLFIAVSGVWK
jgi:hypothetical protein